MLVEGVKMYVVWIILVYAVLMSFWWVLMKRLTNMKAIISEGGAEVSFPNNLVRFASGMGAGMLIIWSLCQNGGLPYLTGLPERFWWSLAGTVSLNVILAYLYLKALEKSVASVAVHITLFSPVIAIFTSRFVFGIDRFPGYLTLMGIVTVLVGLYVLHFNPRKFGWHPMGPFVEIWHSRNRWLWYTVGIAVCGGFSVPLDKQCVQLSDYALAPGMTLFLSWGLVFGIIGVRAGDFAKVKAFADQKPIRLLLLIFIVFGIANGFQAQAYNFQYAAAVASLKRLDAPFTVLWAWLLFPEQERREGHLLFRVIGSIIAFGGAVMIGFGK